MFKQYTLTCYSIVETDSTSIRSIIYYENDISLNQ